MNQHLIEEYKVLLNQKYKTYFIKEFMNWLFKNKSKIDYVTEFDNVVQELREVFNMPSTELNNFNINWVNQFIKEKLVSIEKELAVISKKLEEM